jgi:predicted Zn-dependent protease
MRNLVLKSTAALLILIFASAATFAVIGGPELPDPGRAGMTKEQQIQLGEQAAAEVYKQMPVLPDSSPETQYIRQLGEKLVAQIPPEYSWPFQFHTIAQKEINAFALPGGEMFVNVGTITAASNEAELVGVMAHEMSHVYMMHSAKQASKTSWISGIAGLAGAVLGSGGFLGQLAAAGVQIGSGLVVMKYSRTDEAQADAVGAIIMYKAGYNPQALANFFGKLAAEGGSSPQLLSDHPNPGNREQAREREVANWPPRQYNTNNAAFLRMKEQAEGVKSYNAQQIAEGAKTGQWATLNQKNGAVFRPAAGVAVAQNTSTPAPSAQVRPVSLQEVLPSSQMVNENLGPIRIARPQNWGLIAPQQKGAGVEIAPRAGRTGNGLGYGVAINGVQSQGRSNIDQVTSEIVQHFLGSGDMQSLGNPEPINVAGKQGRSVAMQSTSPFPNPQGQAQKERDWLVTVPQQDGSVVYLVFVAPEAQFDRFRPAYENMLQSLRF